MRTVILALLCLFFTGCASNPYKEFYHDNTEGKDLSTLPVIIPVDDPRIVEGSDPQASFKEMIEGGYVPLGYSLFNGKMQDQNDALSFGKKIHAETVIVFKKFTNTVSGSMPVMMPTTQTSYTNANATVYGSNGRSATVYGSGTTTTHGTQTNYIPYSVDRYEQGAQYWIKMKAQIFGAKTKYLSDEKKRETSSNKGVEIWAVVKGSPAFMSDFLIGDILKKIGGKEIVSPEDYVQTVQSFAGKTVDIDYVRNGTSIKKSVTLNQLPN